MDPKLVRALTLAAVAASALACGSAANPGEESRGTENLPTAGVAPWVKIDVDADISNLIQPFVLKPRLPSEDLREPFGARVEEEYWMWYERREGSGSTAITSEILLTKATTPEGFLRAGPGVLVLSASEPWEEGRVGAPSVLVGKSSEAEPALRFRLWYEGGNHRGIGYATSPDGVHWTKHPGNPVLAATESWERDPAGNGRAGSPSVVLVKGELRMWYDGGDRAGIGAARSLDGMAWSKEDASSHRSPRDSPDVEPVLVPSQPWEGSIVEPHATGHVRAPQVFYDSEAFEPLFKMYYTGFLPVSENPLVHVSVAGGTTPGLTNESVGYAGSRDGLRWTKADPAMNAVLSEELPVEIGKLPFPAPLLDTLPRFVIDLLKTLLGRDANGNPKIPDFQVIYDESEGAVLREGNRFFLWFVQQNSIFIPLALPLPASPFTTELGILVQGTERGIGVAESPGTTAE